jgi:hypothetical protein
MTNEKRIKWQNELARLNAILVQFIILAATVFVLTFTIDDHSTRGIALSALVIYAGTLASGAFWKFWLEEC